MFFFWEFVWKFPPTLLLLGTIILSQVLMDQRGSFDHLEIWQNVRCTHESKVWTWSALPRPNSHLLYWLIPATWMCLISFIKLHVYFPEKSTKMLKCPNVKERETIPRSVPLSDPQKMVIRSVLGQTHPPSKFHGNLFCSFLCNPVDEPTNVHTETGENITSVAKVKNEWINESKDNWTLYGNPKQTEHQHQQQHGALQTNTQST